jgi:hypothetical protein
MKLNDEYSTRSANEAAYVYLNGAVLISAIDERGFETFCFDNKDDFARHLAEKFYEGGTAPARDLLAALAQLRRESSQARRQQQQFHAQGNDSSPTSSGLMRMTPKP